MKSGISSALSIAPRSVATGITYSFSCSSNQDCVPRKLLA